MRAEGGVDIGGGQAPGVVEIGDDLAHEALVKGEGLAIIAEMIREQRQCQLRRAGTLVSPLEPGLRQKFQVMPQRQRFAVDRNKGAGQAARSLIDFLIRSWNCKPRSSVTAVNAC